MTGSILVRGATVATFDDEFRVLKDAWVYAEDGRFIKVGRPEEVRPVAVHPDIEMDGKDRLLMPGFVNTHVHLAQSLLRSAVPDDVTLLDWLTAWVWPMQAVFDEEDGRVSAQLALLEMIKAGTTAFVATSVNGRYGPDRVAAQVHSSGTRCALGRQVMDIPGYASNKGAVPVGLREEKEESLRSFKELYRRWNGKDERIWVWLSPRTPGACSDSLFEEMGEILEERRTGLTMHLAEIKEDVAYFRKRKTSPGRFLGRMGLLRERTVYVHCVWLSDQDIREFARRGSTISHNPSSNMKLGSGVAPVAKMLRAGVNVALGTDGGPSNDSYDMIRECKLASLLQKVALHDPKALGHEEALRMAVTNGYRAMGLDGIAGRIEERFRADFITIDLAKPHLVPTTSVMSNLVYSATGADVSDVFVDGRPLMLDRRVLTLDEAEVLGAAERRGSSLLERAGLRESKS
ncbi:MAG TPA: amidohydrolase [Conexivisphaerales archaeon]|nr:amidohydrolase [Conexivisphaerales archaeon]